MTILAWLAYAGLYLLLVWTSNAAEIAVAFGVATLILVTLWMLRRAGCVPFSIRGRWWLYLAPVLCHVARDCLVVGAAAFRALFGRVPEGETRREPFSVGARDAEGRGRRALVTYAISLAPDSFVAGIDAKGSVLLVHRLLGGEAAAADPRWPV